MDQSGSARDVRYPNLNYGMGIMNNDAVIEIYGRSNNSQLQARTSACSSNNEDLDGSGSGAPGSVNIISQSNNPGHLIVNMQRGLKRSSSEVCFDDCSDDTRQMMSQNQLNISDNCTPSTEDTFTNLGPPKKSPPSNGKKTKGRVKIKMEYIDNKLRRYTTFSKRKTGIMKKAYELSTLTGTQVMLLVASETGHVYTFATRKLQPMITSEAGKALIQTCLNSPDPTPLGSTGDQRMSATGFEETELSYNIAEDEQKVRQLVYGSSHGGNLHVSYASPGGPQSSQHSSPSHSQHTHIISHSHSTTPTSHLVPASSPSPMLAGSSYIQNCPSPLPQTHAPYHSHMTLPHNQR